MQSVTIDHAALLVRSHTVQRAVIECFDGRRWCIVLRGREEFVVRSKRENPKAYAKIETALDELKGFGLRHAEVDFTKWSREQSTLTRKEHVMTVHFDQDNGPGTALTEEHRYAIEEGIKQIDFELGRCGPEYADELNRKRRHLVAELTAGRRLLPQEAGE